MEEGVIECLGKQNSTSSKMWVISDILKSLLAITLIFRAVCLLVQIDRSTQVVHFAEMILHSTGGRLLNVETPVVVHHRCEASMMSFRSSTKCYQFGLFLPCDLFFFF